MTTPNEPIEPNDITRPLPRIPQPRRPAEPPFYVPQQWQPPMPPPPPQVLLVEKNERGLRGSHAALIIAAVAVGVPLLICLICGVMGLIGAATMPATTP